MSYLDTTRKSSYSPYETTVCLTKNECKILLPYFQKAYKNVQMKFNVYQDIHEGGEATERQENLLAKYEEQLNSLENILSSINELIK